MATDYDYIVVGSGAGGGPLACNLARAGYLVALVEAGGDPAKRPDGRTNYNYLVPALHGQSTEDPDMGWDFFVDHYSDPARQRRDSKFESANLPKPDPIKTGVWYPRAGTLGGCTAHNAMITVYPHAEDWEHIRRLTGDDSWSADNMRPYFQKIEDCMYRSPSPNSGQHGFNGWLSTNLADPLLVLNDPLLLKIVLSAVRSVLIRKLAVVGGTSPAQALRLLLKEFLGQFDALRQEKATIPTNAMNDLTAAIRSIEEMMGSSNALESVVSGAGIASLLPDGLLMDARASLVESLLKKLPLKELLPLLVRFTDPNDIRVTKENRDGIFTIPLATNGVQRNGTREYIRRTLEAFPFHLELFTESLVTQVLIEGGKAVGVQYVKQPNAYFASPKADRTQPLGPRLELRVRKTGEVILAGGAFNTPQLLMLSGVGPKDVLDAHKIERKSDFFLSGVGRNLQDRYEVGVSSVMKGSLAALALGKFVEPSDPNNPGDPFFDEWKKGRGVYTTNGSVLGIVQRSRHADPTSDAPDLFIFGLPGSFHGYFHGYATKFVAKPNVFTWAILKGHTRNTAGSVTLRDTDPRTPPIINFRYFDEGNGDHVKDLESIVEAIDFVKDLMGHVSETEKTLLLPDLDLDNPAKVRDFIKNEAWGHHACGTCAIGPDPAQGAVVDSRFRVHGVRSLRVVDASVFPRIPGFFIAVPIYMISEKASQVILEDAP